MSKKETPPQIVARTWRVQGRVQGVGFRYFVKQNADVLGVRGFVRNEDDGSVFAYAFGNSEQINRFGAAIRTGPRFSEVRGVEEKESSVLKYNSFIIEH